MAELGIDASGLKAMAKRLRQEADGKRLRRDLIAGMRTAAGPAVDRARSAIRAAPSTGGRRKGGSLRDRIARRLKVQVATGGRRAGVRVVVKKRIGLPRGFVNAPRRLNRKGGWRHPVFGTDVWVTQVGHPGWFDDSMTASAGDVRRAARKVLDAMASRLAGR